MNSIADTIVSKEVNDALCEIRGDFMTRVDHMQNNFYSTNDDLRRKIKFLEDKLCALENKFEYIVNDLLNEITELRNQTQWVECET